MRRFSGLEANSTAIPAGTRVRRPADSGTPVLTKLPNDHGQADGNGVVARKMSAWNLIFSVPSRGEARAPAKPAAAEVAKSATESLPVTLHMVGYGSMQAQNHNPEQQACARRCRASNEPPTCRMMAA